MRIAGLSLLIVLGFSSYSCGRATQVASLTPAVVAKELTPGSTNTAKVDFDTQIEPLLKAKCQPCHFSGGKVFDKLPFDKPQTIKMLGTKLFTRIHDENERKLIRDFLSQE